MSLMSEEMGIGPYSVTEIQHSTVTLSDGTKLAMKVWLPCRKDEIKTSFPYFATEKQLKWSNELNFGCKQPASGEGFPTILEYLPYSKDSVMTLQRDHSRHSWFCSHGFVDIRLDLRGTGASEGLYYDEYDEQEFDDCIEAIEWITSQQWSNEKVGMYGKSWGGFNGLQIAYKQPKALKAVISLYSTDNRFSDDMHYEGNAMIGNGLLSWAGFMMAINSRAPHPNCFDSIDEWKRIWINRLQNASQSFLCSWLHHQHPRDPYWSHGSICQNISRVKCPVLVIGGHTDSYTSAAFRMAAQLNEYSRAIIGPWSHQWPDVAIPGPNIDYLNICLKWWSAYLKDDITFQKVVFDWPRLNLYIRDSMKPNEVANSHIGKWVSLVDWDLRMNTYNLYPTVPSNSNFLRKVYLGCDRNLMFNQSTNNDESIELKPNPKQGIGSGLWLSVDDGFPEDQTTANENSLCWLSEILDVDIVFAGLSKMFVSLKAKTSDHYCIHVRVCDQHPTGESFLVTRGFLNLSESTDGWVRKLPANTKSTKCVNLKGVGHTIPSGHRLLIAITPSYFPIVYPPVSTNGISIYPAESCLVFQTCEDLENKITAYPPPNPLFQLPVNQITPAHFATSDSQQGDGYVRDVHDNSGKQQFPSMGFEYEMKSHERYVTDENVSFGDISANQTIETTFHVNDQKIETHIETSQKMSGDKQVFRVNENIKVILDGEEIFSKEWDNLVPRKFV